MNKYSYMLQCFRPDRIKHDLLVLKAASGDANKSTSASDCFSSIRLLSYRNDNGESVSLNTGLFQPADVAVSARIFC
jgi:hypothetical protein